MPTMQIVFTDPPPPRRRMGRSQHPWAAIAEQLKARPGEWALCLRDMYDSSASAIRSGKMTAFPKGEYEARAVIPDEKMDQKSAAKDRRKQPIFDLYIRYLGPATTDEEES